MSPCRSCHGGCCRSFAVPLTGADILRIAREFQLAFRDFVCRWPDADGRIARNHAPHFFFSDEPRVSFVVGLVHRPSTFAAGTTQCRFLVECEPDAESPLGLARCGIYEHRPAACRVFPTRLNESGDAAVIHSVPKRGRPGDNPVYDLCPESWEPSDCDPIQAVHDLVIAQFEMNFFHQVAAWWNSQPQAWDLFPDFLYEVYSNRVRKDVEESAIPDQADHATIRQLKSFLENAA